MGHTRDRGNRGVVDGSPTTSEVVVLSLRGEHDTFEAERLAHALGGVWEPGDERPIIIDLADATFIDSTVLSVMLRALKEAERVERPLVIHLPPSAGEYVHRLIDTTGLDSVLPLVSSWDATLARAGVSEATRAS
jgi:anti-anti-sigma factor